jgi:hypothetical protein
MMYTVTAPFQIYAQRLEGGQVLLYFYSQNFLWQWLAFLAVGAAVYYLIARSLFASAMTHGLKVGFSAVAAQVAGMFGVVISFYVVFFFFSPAKVQAWCMELTLLIVWFLYFLFSYFTAPESR